MGRVICREEALERYPDTPSAGRHRLRKGRRYSIVPGEMRVWGIRSIRQQSPENGNKDDTYLPQEAGQFQREYGLQNQGRACERYKVAVRVLGSWPKCQSGRSDSALTSVVQ